MGVWEGEEARFSPRGLLQRGLVQFLSLGVKISHVGDWDGGSKRTERQHSPRKVFDPKSKKFFYEISVEKGSVSAAPENSKCSPSLYPLSWSPIMVCLRWRRWRKGCTCQEENSSSSTGSTEEDQEGTRPNATDLLESHQRLSGPNRVMPLRRTMRFELRTPKSPAMRKLFSIARDAKTVFTILPKVFAVKIKIFLEIIALCKCNFSSFSQLLLMQVQV